MSDPIFEITKVAVFDAAHYLDQGPPDHRYRRLHGHSFRVEASLKGALIEDAGWVGDLAALDEALRGVAGQLDHGLLTERPGLETPTLEHLCLHFAAALKPRFPRLSKIVVSRPTLGESCALSID